MSCRKSIILTTITFLILTAFCTPSMASFDNSDPALAAAIASSEPLKMLVRILLAPIIASVYMIYHPLLLLTMAMILLAFYTVRKTV